MSAYVKDDHALSPLYTVFYLTGPWGALLSGYVEATPKTKAVLAKYCFQHKIVWQAYNPLRYSCLEFKFIRYQESVLWL